MYSEYEWGRGATPSNVEDFRAIRNIFSNYSKSGVILDYGCGNGSIAISLIKEGYDVYGVDASVSGIRNANNEYKKLYSEMRGVLHFF